MKKRRLSKAIRQLPLAGLVLAATLLVQSCGNSAPETEPDPKEVQRFLTQLDERYQQLQGEAERKAGHEKRLRNLIEGAATRAPSEAAINKIETAVVSGLSG